MITTLSSSFFSTPQYGAISFYGIMSKRVYSKDIYVSDVAAALVNFDSGNGASATSETSLQFPEPVVIRDFSMITGTADTTKLQLTANGTPTGDILRYTVHLNTLAFRPVLQTVFPAGARIAAIQLA